MKPCNTSILDSLGDEGFTDMILEFLREAKVGEVQEGTPKTLRLNTCVRCRVEPPFPTQPMRKYVET